jgi:Ser/Thr protein kinase RdoA (MazF antagonist)
LTGDSLLILDGDFFEIQEYIEHTAYTHGRAAHFDAAASMLAVYHRCVEGFAAGPLRAHGELYSPATVGDALARLSEAWKTTRASTVARLARRLAEHTRDLELRFAAHGQLTYLVIHGDYYADNLLFRDDRIVGVVDYDKARWEPRVAELAEALIYFASPRPGYTEHLVYPGVLRWEPLTRFLNSYTAGLMPEQSEMRALPDYVRAIWLSVSLQLLAKKEPSAAQAECALLELLQLADWARDNTQRMTGIAYQTRQGVRETRLPEAGSGGMGT